MPAMGAEVLGGGRDGAFVTELEGCVAGKTIGLFGSYGWGDGEWMRDWVERMTAAGATVVAARVLSAGCTGDDAKTAMRGAWKEAGSGISTICRNYND